MRRLFAYAMQWRAARYGALFTDATAAADAATPLTLLRVTMVISIFAAADAVAAFAPLSLSRLIFSPRAMR